MDIATLVQRDETAWEIPRRGSMRVPAVVYADRVLVEAMDAKVAEQAANVARLPGVVDTVYCMPDAHWGYGFPIGGVAAFDPGAGGVVSAGGVGFDISCGVGAAGSEARAFSSACHGAGRAMSRHAATRQWRGREVVDELARRGILVRSRSLRGVAEEAPLAYKDVATVVAAAEHAGLARRVARLEPMVCIKG